MSKENLSKGTSVNLSLAHLIIVWDILANKLAGEPIKKVFSVEEKRAIWALQDLCENELIANGIAERPEKEWDSLVGRATKLARTIPAEYLD